MELGVLFFMCVRDFVLLPYVGDFTFRLSLSSTTVIRSAILNTSGIAALPGER